MKAYGYMGSTSLHAPAVLFVLVQATTCTLSPVLKADTVEAHLRRKKRGGSDVRKDPQHKIPFRGIQYEADMCIPIVKLLCELEHGMS